jgi:hypothetical protein
MDIESRIERHKKLLDEVLSINNSLIDIQEEKFKVLTDFLEYEEALTKDKDTASRIKSLLISIGVWQTSITQ